MVKRVEINECERFCFSLFTFEQGHHQSFKEEQQGDDYLKGLDMFH